MTKLTYEAREKHLEKNPEQQKEWTRITKKTGKEIFELLSEKPYTTSFEIRKTDNYYQNTFRFYHDYGFKKALEAIKSQLWITWALRYQTIDKIISFTQEIQALADALDTTTKSSPQTLLKKEQNSDLYRRDENGVWYFNFFEEEKQKPQLNITKPEPKEHNITDNEKSSTSEQNTEDEGRDENDYSNRLRDH